MWCALPKRSMRLCPKGISKIAETTTTFQRSPLKIVTSRWPPPKHVYDNKLDQGAPITMISVSISMFMTSNKPHRHVKRLITQYINGETVISGNKTFSFYYLPIL